MTFYTPELERPSFEGPENYQVSPWDALTNRFSQPTTTDKLGTLNELTVAERGEVDIDAMKRMRAEGQIFVEPQFTGPDSPVITAAEANELGAEVGLKFTEDKPRRYIEKQIELRKRELQHEYVMQRAPQGLAMSAGLFLTDLVAGIFDPVEIAAAVAVPVPGTKFLSGRIAATALGKSGARVTRGAIEGAVGTAAIEPIHYQYAASTYDDDYGMAQSLLNIAVGAGLGSGLHWAGGVGGDALRNYSNTSALRVASGFDKAALKTLKRQVGEDEFAELAQIAKTSKTRDLFGELGAEELARTIDAMPPELRRAMLDIGVRQALNGMPVNLEPILRNFALPDDLKLYKDEELLLKAPGTEAEWSDLLNNSKVGDSVRLATEDLIRRPDGTVPQGREAVEALVARYKNRNSLKGIEIEVSDDPVQTALRNAAIAGDNKVNTIVRDSDSEYPEKVITAINDISRSLGIKPRLRFISWATFRRMAGRHFDTHKNADGINMPRSDADYIALNPTKMKDEAAIVDVAMHEFGHTLQREVWDKAPKEVKRRLTAEFDAWKKQSQTQTVTEFYSSNYPPGIARNYLARMPKHMRSKLAKSVLGDWTDYHMGLHEYIANQTARWAATNKMPQTIVERFYSGLVQMWKDIISSFPGMKERLSPDGNLANPEIAKYLNELAAKNFDRLQQEYAAIDRPTGLQGGKKLALYADDDLATTRWQIERALDELEGVQSGDGVWFRYGRMDHVNSTAHRRILIERQQAGQNVDVRKTMEALAPTKPTASRTGSKPVDQQQKALADDPDAQIEADEAEMAELVERMGVTDEDLLRAFDEDGLSLADAIKADRQVMQEASKLADYAEKFAACMAGG
jgi:hypothetical protein